MGSRKILSFKRRRQGLTNYQKRLSLLKSGKLRFVIRKTNKKIICQAVDFDPKGDKVLLSVDSKDLSEYGWKYSYSNLPASYLTGYLFAKKAMNDDLNRFVADLGRSMKTKGNKIFAVLKGAADAGLDFPYSEDKFPSNERIKGKHIVDYFKKNPDHFSDDDVDKLTDVFDKVLKKLDKI